MRINHTLNPIYNKYSKILILGSVPSIISRKEKFYYANKNNRFWKVISILYNINFSNNKDKKQFLFDNNIALWDVIDKCDINASNDSSIKNVKLNNIYKILNNSNIKKIFCIGRLAYNLFIKNYNIPCTYLPSTSSANANYSLKMLVEEYKKILKQFILILLILHL